jgi:hypothetical protein
VVGNSAVSKILKSVISTFLVGKSAKKLIFKDYRPRLPGSYRHTQANLQAAKLVCINCESVVVVYFSFVHKSRR